MYVAIKKRISENVENDVLRIRKTKRLQTNFSIFTFARRCSIIFGCYATDLARDMLYFII